MKETSINQEIIELVDSFKYLNDMAYVQYKPEVDHYVALLNKGVDIKENKICLLLDYMLSFCGDDRILQLYKKLLRAMWPKYAAAVSDYVNFYKEQYEEKDTDELLKNNINNV